VATRPLPAEIRAAAAGQAALTELAPPFHEWLESLPPEHLFGEYLHLIGALLPEIRAEELSAMELNRIAELAEPLIRYFNTLYKLQHAPAPEETIQEMPRCFFIRMKTSYSRASGFMSNTRSVE
jgi:hypothetical protein